MIHRAGRTIAACALALALAGALAPRADAHATLESTTPERGAALERPPGEVVLRFSEPVEVAFGAVRVIDAGGRQVARGDAYHPDGAGSAVAVRLPPDLPRGGYTVTYRVISADSHPVSGGFVFGVGAGAAAPATEIADLLEGQDSGPVTSTAFAATRAVQYGAIALALGLLAVLLAVWSPGLRATAGSGERWSGAAAAFSGRADMLLLAAAAAGVASALLGLVLQTAVAGGTTFWAAIGETGSILETRFGIVWGLGALAWAIVLVLVSMARATRAGSERTPDGARLFLLGVPLLALAFLPGLGGHAGTQEPVAVLLPANVLHVLAASAWIGGLATLVLALPSATRRLEDGDRTRLLSAVLGRFSTLALAAVAVLLAGGILQSLLELDALDDLWESAFGRAILVKAALVTALLALGALNRRRILPALRRAEGERASPGAPGCCCGARCAPRSRSGPRRSPPPARSPATRPRPPRRPARSAPPPTSAPRAPSSPSTRPAPARTTRTCTCSPAPTGASTTRPANSPSRRRCRVAASRRSACPRARRDRATTSSAAPRSPPLATGASKSQHESRSSTSSAPRSPSRSTEGDPMHKLTLTFALAAAALLAPAAASAHVTLQPESAPAGGFTRLDVRVPNERDDKGTTKVVVRFPAGSSTRPTSRSPAGRRRSRARARTSTRSRGRPRARRRDRARSVPRLRPLGRDAEGKAGDKLTFKALQTYEGGEVVRWIGPADADEPAPQVTLTAASGEEDAGHEAGSGGGPAAPALAQGRAAATATTRSRSWRWGSARPGCSRAPRGSWSRAERRGRSRRGRGGYVNCGIEGAGPEPRVNAARSVPPPDVAALTADDAVNAARRATEH